MDAQSLDSIRGTSRSCRQCGASLVMVQTQKNRGMPCLAEPVMLSNAEEPSPIVKHSSLIDLEGKTYADHRSAPKGVLLFVIHWALCPGADKERKKGRKQ